MLRDSLLLITHYNKHPNKTQPVWCIKTTEECAIKHNNISNVIQGVNN